MRRHLRLRALILLFAAILAAAPALAAGRRPAARTPPQAPGVFASLWQALERLLPPLTKGVGTIDPDGASAPPPNSNPSDGETDGRGTIDPNG